MDIQGFSDLLSAKQKRLERKDKDPRKLKLSFNSSASQFDLMSSLQFPSKIHLERCICKETRRKLRTTLYNMFKTIGGTIGTMGLVKPTSRALLLHSLFPPGSVFPFLFFPLPFHALMLSLFRIMFRQPLGTVLQFARCTNALLISVLLKCNQNKRFNFSNTFDIS